jgi:hypothetical protein
MINFNSPTYALVDFNTPIYTPIELNQTTFDRVDFNTPIHPLIFDDLNLPQFLTDDLAIAALSGNQAYQLIVSRVVKVTPPGLISNIWANFSKAFSYFRRAF